VFALQVHVAGKLLESKKLSIKFTHGPSSATNSKVSGAGLTSGVVNEDVSISLDAYDNCGNRQKRGGDSVQAFLRGPETVDASVTDKGDGLYTIVARVALSGTYGWSLSLNGKPVSIPARDSVRLLAGPVEPLTTLIFGSALTTPMTAGKPASVFVQLRDVSENNRTIGGDAISAELVSTQGKIEVPSVLDNADGTYKLTYKTLKSGEYSLRVFLGLRQLGGLTHTISILPAAPSPKDCIASGSGLASGIVGAAAQFTVEVRDKFGNTVAQIGSAKLQVDLSGAAAPDAKVDGPKDGVFTVSYTPSQAGKYAIMVRLDKRPIAGCPYTATVSAPASRSLGIEEDDR
jgi:hypothetical protein